nr:immunoglobulin light chain junction region [Mus musculus]
CLQYDEFPRTF